MYQPASSSTWLRVWCKRQENDRVLLCHSRSTDTVCLRIIGRERRRYDIVDGEDLQLSKQSLVLDSALAQVSVNSAPNCYCYGFYTSPRLNARISRESAWHTLGLQITRLDSCCLLDFPLHIDVEPVPGRLPPFRSATQRTSYTTLCALITSITRADHTHKYRTCRT